MKYVGKGGWTGKHDINGQKMVSPRLKKELNTFLSGWLLNLKKQGFHNPA